MKNINFDQTMENNSLIDSFGYAIKGFKHALKERNFMLHLLSASIVIFAGFYFQISKIEWIIILLCIAGVLALELVNTALEKLTDLASPNHHPLAGAAKDMSASAVLVFSIISAIVGGMIFIPYFVN